MGVTGGGVGEVAGTGEVTGMEEAVGTEEVTDMGEAAGTGERAGLGATGSGLFSSWVRLWVKVEGDSGITAILNRFMSSGLIARGGRKLEEIVGEKELARLRVGDDDVEDIDRDGFRDTGGGGGGGFF